MAAARAELLGRLVHDAPMARYSSWRAGGHARVLFMPASAADLALFWQREGLTRPVHFIGLGSNLLVRDGGVSEPVVRLAPGLRELTLGEGGRVHAQAGVAMPKLAKFAAANGLGQAGFMAGIPGSVGGALAMNAGCFGCEVWQLVEAATLIDDHGELVTVPAREFAFSYRSVSHATLDTLRFVAATFSFAPLAAGELEADRAVMAKREASQPIGTANAGSVFINPPGDSAGRLIEAAGLAGFSIGAAQISPKHCNFIVNTGAASAREIEELILHAQAKVKQRFAIALRPEVRIIGKDA